MFPPSLQKNIQELDRQISLLEMECENMESEKKDLEKKDPSPRINPKPFARELPNKPFVTGPSFSASFYSAKKSGQSSTMYSASCAQIKATCLRFFGEKGKSEMISTTEERSVTVENDAEKNSTPCKGTAGKDTESSCESKEPPKQVTTKEGLSTSSSGERDEQAITQKDTKNPSKRSISSIREVSESSEDAPPVCGKNVPSKKPDQKWCELFSKPTPADTAKEAKGKKTEVRTSTKSRIKSQKSKHKPSEAVGHDLGCHEEKHLIEKWVHQSDRSLSPQNRLSSKRRRPRSVRTRKKSLDEVPVEVTLEKALHEKEIQCMLWNEEREKAEFLVNLNDSIRTLHLLIGELKRNSSQEKRNDVINDMQNTLMKISGIKSMNAINGPLAMLASVTNSKYLEGENNIIDLKKTLFGVKQFCEELSDEKLIMSDELAAKNRTIASLKNKEKEYLSLISSLKFNLEKIKEEAEEGMRSKRDVKILKNKLYEEAKVIEALKKSHGKMQELVENYALTNDKLKTQVKIARLESHKYNVLLAGKEVEINKYKEEIQSFQRQITEQLSLLRSKASEIEVEKAMEALSNQSNILRSTEVESCLSETTVEKKDSDRNLTPARKNSSEVPKKSNQSENNKREVKKTTIPPFKEMESDCKKPSASQSLLLKETEGKTKIAKTASSKSESEAEVHVERVKKNKYELKGVLDDSTNLRTSIDEILHEMRMDSSEKFWSSTPTSFNTSQCSVSSSAENTSERSQ